MRRTTLVIPGRVQREPGIHWAAVIAVGWIPGSRRFASRPGMTDVVVHSRDTNAPEFLP
jgi:hypothetical protein